MASRSAESTCLPCLRAVEIHPLIRQNTFAPILLHLSVVVWPNVYFVASIVVNQHSTFSRAGDQIYRRSSVITLLLSEFQLKASLSSDIYTYDGKTFHFQRSLDVSITNLRKKCARPHIWSIVRDCSPGSLFYVSLRIILLTI